MRSLNRVFLIGHVGRDPVVRMTTSGTKVANFTMATNEVWRDNMGQRQERTEWHRIVVFGNLADLAERYIRKGRFIMVEGRIQSRQYTDNSGQTRYVTEIVARDIRFLEPRAAVESDVVEPVMEPIEPPPAFEEPEESVETPEEDLDFLI